MSQKLEEYKNSLKSDPKMVSTLMKNPAGELMKQTGLKLTSKQGETINSHFFSAKKFADSFIQAGNSKNEQAREREAPYFLHNWMDMIYDLYHFTPGSV